MGGIARSRALTATGFILSCAYALFCFATVARARPTTVLQSVRYRGVSLRIPRSWPVFDLARSPHTCVRFNRHAVYLGTPGPEERCPAHAVGRTDAILLSPLRAARGGSNGAVGALNLDGDATSYSLRKPGIEVTATWSRSPRALAQALGRKSLPAANGSGLSTAPPPNVSQSANGAPSAPVAQ